MPSPVYEEWQKFRQACTDLSTCLDNREGWRRYRREHPEDKHGYGFKPGMYNTPKSVKPPVTPAPAVKAPALRPVTPSTAPSSGVAIYRNPHDAWQEQAARRMGLGIGPEFNDKI